MRTRSGVRSRTIVVSPLTSPDPTRAVAPAALPTATAAGADRAKTHLGPRISQRSNATMAPIAASSSSHSDAPSAPNRTDSAVAPASPISPPASPGIGPELGSTIACSDPAETASSRIPIARIPRCVIDRRETLTPRYAAPPSTSTSTPTPSASISQYATLAPTGPHQFSVGSFTGETSDPGASPGSNPIRLIVVNAHTPNRTTHPAARAAPVVSTGSAPRTGFFFIALLAMAGQYRPTSPRTGTNRPLIATPRASAPFSRPSGRPRYV